MQLYRTLSIFIVAIALASSSRIDAANAQVIPKSLQEGGSDAAIKQRKNAWTVGIAGGLIDGTERYGVRGLRRRAVLAVLALNHGVVVSTERLLDADDAATITMSAGLDGKSSVSLGEGDEATPLEECERRDVKGLYARARRGELRNFTGIDDPYEPPETPELTLDTRALSVEQCVAKVLARFEG